MVALSTPLRIVGGMLLLFGNGFFVTTEFALTRVRQFAEEEFVGQGKGLERAWEMTERLEIYLSGCQVGITVCSVGLGVVAEPAVAAVFGPLFGAVGLGNEGAHGTAAVVAALAVINVLHVIVGEQAPTYLGIERTKRVAKYGGPILHYWTKLMWPVIIFSDRVAKWLLGLFGVTISRSWAEEEAEGKGGDRPSTRGELRSQMGESLSRLGVSDERADEVINALEIGRTPVSEIMVERDDVVTLSTDDPVEENLDRVESHPHVRFPLVGDSLDDPRGTVYTPALLRSFESLREGETTLVDVAAPSMDVAVDTAVSDVIDQMQVENQELALVRDGGTVVGLVTATDAFEAITGELADPLDR